MRLHFDVCVCEGTGISEFLIFTLTALLSSCAVLHFQVSVLWLFLSRCVFVLLSV